MPVHDRLGQHRGGVEINIIVHQEKQLGSTAVVDRHLMVGGNDYEALLYTDDGKHSRPHFPPPRQQRYENSGGQSLAASSSLYNRAMEWKARMSPARTMFPSRHTPGEARTNKMVGKQGGQTK